jgi:hypothetical protein
MYEDMIVKIDLRLFCISLKLIVYSSWIFQKTSNTIIKIYFLLCSIRKLLLE